MVKITRQNNENCRKARFIGKKYTDGAHWGEWWQNGWFDVLEKAPGISEMNDNGYIGLMRSGESGFEYWIGMFFHADSEVPCGFEYLDVTDVEFAIFYIYGSEQNGEIFGEVPYKMCIAELEKESLRASADCLRFERYSCPRYTAPDEKGNVILDYAIALSE